MRPLGERGITLVELLLTLFLIGLIAKITIPSTSSTEVAELEKAESFLLEAFRFARQEAMRSGNTCGITIDTSTKRIRGYRYDASATTVGARKVYTVDAAKGVAGNPCLLHPVTKQSLDFNYGSGTDYPRLSIGAASFRGRSGVNTSIYRTGDVQFDATGMPFVFDGTNEPVPLTTPSPSTASPIQFTVGSLPTRGLTVCRYLGNIVIKKPNKDADDPCEG